MGGETQTKWEKHQGNARDQNKREALARFTNIAKRVMDTATEAHIRHFFRPSKEKARRPLPLGIVTHLGATTALPQWSKEVAESVAQTIIEMTHVRTAHQAKQLTDQSLTVCQRPVRLVGKALGQQQGDVNLIQRFVKRRREEIREAKGRREEPTAEGEEHASISSQVASDMFVLKCPHCANERCPTGKFNLTLGASWKQIPCNACQRNTSASKWRCNCDIEWHRCQVHRPLGFELEPPKRKPK